MIRYGNTSTSRRYDRLSILLYRSERSFVGRFHCPAGDRAWREENRVRHGPLFVFPQVPVVIHQQRGEPVLAEPMRIMLYNEGEPYHRRLVDDRGDICVFFGADRESVREIVAGFDPAARDRDAVLPFCDAPCPSGVYLLQQQLCCVAGHRGDDDPDVLELDERLLELILASVQAAFEARGVSQRRSRPATARAHRDLARETRLLLASRCRQRLTLDELAAFLHTTPFHLCRVFRAQTGTTLHAYRTSLRLREALEPVLDGRDLTDVGLDVGFSSHSHFTAAFRREFGVTPSAFRRAAARSSRHGPRRSARGRGRRSSPAA